MAHDPWVDSLKRTFATIIEGLESGDLVLLSDAHGSDGDQMDLRVVWMKAERPLTQEQVEQLKSLTSDFKTSLGLPNA